LALDHVEFDLFAAHQCEFDLRALRHSIYPHCVKINKIFVANGSPGMRGGAAVVVLAVVLAVVLVAVLPRGCCRGGAAVVVLPRECCRHGAATAVLPQFCWRGGADAVEQRQWC